MTISTVMSDTGCAKGARQAGFAAVQSIAMAVSVLLLLSAAAAAWNSFRGCLGIAILVDFYFLFAVDRFNPEHGR